jgi:hypothetical protein
MVDFSGSAPDEWSASALTKLMTARPPTHGQARVASPATRISMQPLCLADQTLRSCRRLFEIVAPVAVERSVAFMIEHLDPEWDRVAS